MSEHLDTKSIVDLRSSVRDSIVILVKWGPPGRLINRRMAVRIPVNRLRSRDPVSLGEVEGVSHTSLLCARVSNARSSRRGKEQIISKTSGGVEVKRGDLRAGDNPWNGAGGAG